MKILDIFEVRYYRDDDKFECPDCRGKGWQTYFFQTGEDDYDKDIEPCETCDEKGYLTRTEVAGRQFDKETLNNLKQITEASYAFPGGKKITFSELSRMVKKNDAEGIILLGAGGDLKDWINGVSSQLYDQGVATSGNPVDLWAGAYELTTSGGRTDLALEFKRNDNSVNVGKLAMWRLQFGDASWFTDYVENFKDQH